MTILRDYQEQALAAEAEARTADPTATRLLVEMATGLGKTVTFAARAARHLEGDLGRVLALVHTDELVRQAVRTIRAVVPGRWTVGVVKAAEDEVDADIVVASVQTLARRERRARITGVTLVIVDEAHHAVAPTYREILEHYGAFGCLPCRTGARHADGVMYWNRSCPETTPVLGVTATAARGDGQALGHVWQDLVFSRGISWAIRRGHLVDVAAFRVTIPDFSLGRQNTAPGADGDYSDRAVATALAASTLAPELVAERYNEVASDLSGVIFCPDVASSHRFAEAFNAAGIKTEVVTGAMPQTERDAVLDRLANGTTQVVANCMVLTEGWDCPRVKAVVVARPTRSAPLFIQMAGRGLRPWIGPDAPPRAEQHAVLITVSDGVTSLCSVADLSDRPLPADEDGTSLTRMEDEWDLGAELDTEAAQYRGPAELVRFDPLTERSSKVWQYTSGGHPFLPIGKRQDYVFLLREGDGWSAFSILHSKVRRHARDIPDLELAMATAEDLALELGGDVGRLLADKGRAWRKAVPGEDMRAMADRLGVQYGDILASKAGGKAGKLSDRMDRVLASRRVDPAVGRIKERTGAA